MSIENPTKCEVLEMKFLDSYELGDDFLQPIFIGGEMWMANY